MSVVETSVRRPIGVAMIALAVLVVGLVAARQLAVDLLPAVDFPRISIVTTYEGVGPEEIETLITRPIEQVISTIEGIESIESTSAEGISRIQVQFGWGTNLDNAVNDVRAYMDRLGSTLPDQAERPVVFKFDLSSVPIAEIGVSGGGDPRRLRYLADETLSRRLERVPGVASVSVQGGRVREIRVELDAAQMIALDVSAREISAALTRENRNVSAGDMRSAGRQLLVRSVGQWESVEEIAGTLVAIREKGPIYLHDVATVTDGFKEQNAEQWVDGKPGIALSISKQSGANTVEVAARVRAEMERINREYAGRVLLTMLVDSSDFIRRSVSNVQTSALAGAGLAVLVLLVFLRNVRATFVIAIAIPLSVLAALGLMYFSGFTLNVISFGGLALGIGMLVDNGIVILENIYRKREEGLPILRAAIEGAQEVVSAVVAGTLTTMVVFAPVVFMGGFASVFFGEMAAVVTFALLCSLVIAVTLVPSVSAKLIGAVGAPRGPLAWVANGIGAALGAVDRGYQATVRAALRAPWFVLALATLLLVASTRLVPLIGYELMPDTDEGQIDADIEFPVGTPIEHTGPWMLELERRARAVMEEHEVASIMTSAGPENWWRTEGSNVGELEINLVPVTQRARRVNEIMAALRKELARMPGADIRVRQGNVNILMRIMRGGQDERLAVDIRGHDRETAEGLAARVIALMESVPGVSNAYVDKENSLEERAVRVDATRAGDLGLLRADIAETLETYVLGRVVTRFREQGDEFDVRVQLRAEDRWDVEQLGQLPVHLPGGGTTPLQSVADSVPRSAPNAIERENQERIVRVLGAVGDRSLGAIVADLARALEGVAVPDDFTMSIAGEHEEQEETFLTLLIGILLALFLVYTVMAVQFESLLHPLIIMAAVPFAFIGVVVTLVVTDTTFNMNSFLGAIVLVGVVVNNAIVLVDTVNLSRRAQGRPLVEALQEATARRLRPILMTTLTTVLAMLPLAAGTGEGSEVQAPLARVVVGGLLTSTLVTLVVVPCLYLIVERARGALRAVEVRATDTTPASDARS